MTTNEPVVNPNEFFCVPIGKSRQAAIFLGNLIKNAIEEGKRLPRRMEASSDLGTCIKRVEDVRYAYSAFYSARCRGMMKGEGQSMRIALEFLSRIFKLLSADECMLGWREFCSKGKKIVAALNSLCGEASLLAKNLELQNVTKYCIEGSDMLRSIADIWDLASGVAEDNEERSFRAAFPQDTAVGTVFRDFVGSKLIVMAMEKYGGVVKFRDRNWGKVFTLGVIKPSKVDPQMYGYNESGLPEELGPWAGLSGRAAHVNEEPSVCDEERRGGPLA